MSELVRLYDFREQHQQVAAIQKQSRRRGDMGLAKKPLVGSRKWWREIETGTRPTHQAVGKIADAYWGSMADWPEFQIADESGEVSTWTREGDPRRYVPGLAARVEFVMHPWKNPDGVLGAESDIVLGIWVEDSPRRLSGIAPGPGGVGYQYAREHGEALHYLYLPFEDAAEKLARPLEREGSKVRVWPATASEWVVQLWDEDPDRAQAESRRRELHALARAAGGRYDGGEVIEGEVWGPVSD